MNFNRIQEAEVKLWDFSEYFWNTPRITNILTNTRKLLNILCIVYMYLSSQTFEFLSCTVTLVYEF